MFSVQLVKPRFDGKVSPILIMETVYHFNIFSATLFLPPSSLSREISNLIFNKKELFRRGKNTFHFNTSLNTYSQSHVSHSLPVSFLISHFLLHR